MKTLRIVCNILLAVIVAAALALAVILVVPLVMGNRLYAVQTASMEPAYPVGSLVAVRPTGAADIAVDDVITFSMPGFDTPVTHRVIEINEAEQTFLTKGDNNPNTDFFPVPFNNLEGRVAYGIPYLGRLVSGLQTPGGWLVLAWVGFIIVLLLFLPDIVSRLREPAPGPQEAKEPRPARAPALSKKANAVKYPALERMLAERGGREQAGAALPPEGDGRWYYRPDR